MFTPNIVNVGSGVHVAFYNEDTISHHIVLDRYGAPTGWSVTVAPGQYYISPDALTCSGTCSSAGYVYRDANLSTVNSYRNCTKFCARVTVYNNGT